MRESVAPSRRRRISHAKMVYLVGENEKERGEEKDERIALTKK